MKRHSFRTINTLELHSLVYICLMCVVLLIFFLVLGNVGKIVQWADLDSGKADQTIQETILTDGTGKLLSSRISPEVSDHPEILSRFAGGNGDSKVALWGDGVILDSLSSQLVIMEQSYDRISSLEAPDDYELLVAAKEEYSDEDLAHIQAYVENGGNVWLTNISRALVKKNEAQELMGIRTAGSVKTWPGIRYSGDIALGSVMENPEYEVTGVNLTLSNKIKLYASALPENYKDMENKDLPPLIWRYVPRSGGGAVYVCNGDFMEAEVLYLMLPTIFSELHGNYVYGILNAYCVFVEDFPYAQNEERESWQRLYSRDKLSIAQDLLSAQYLRYYTDYGARITYFSRDRQELVETEDKELKYYTETIDSSMGLLALKDRRGLFLEDNREKLKITDWKQGSAFAERGSYCLPVNFDYSAENDEEVIANLLGSVVGTGYYAFTNDVDLLLDYDGTADIWDDYCKNQEVVFGIGVQQCGWLERVTAAQALERIYSHFTANADITYSNTGVEIFTDAEHYWLILKGKAEKIKVTGGTAELIGERCWLIDVDSGHAVISYQ